MNLVFVPFAYIKNANTSVNLKKTNYLVDIYLKNSFVALKSIKLLSDVVVAIVTNYKIEESFKKLFLDNGIKVIDCPFDSFKFPDSYPWCLAFYKFCAFNFVIKKFKYENYLMLDCDVVAVKNIENLFNKNDGIIFHEHGGTICLKHSFEKINPLLKDGVKIKRVGGEFLLCNYANSNSYIKLASAIFDEMEKNNIVITYGDEYISSIVANILNNSLIKKQYISRVWTGSYRDVPHDLHNSYILHVPAEKNDGMIKLFNYFLKNKFLPKNEIILKILHVYKISFINKIKRFLKSVLKLN